MRRTRPAPPPRDDGSILVMALVLVVTFGVLVGSLATYAAVSFRHTSGSRALTEMRASADAGIRVTIDQLTRHQTLCADLAATPVPLGVSPNGAAVEVSCTSIAGANLSTNTFAVVLTGVGANSTYPSLLSSGGGERKVGGALYMAVPASHDVTNFLLEGDLWYFSPTCPSGSPPAIAGMTITPSPPRTKICTPTPWEDLVPALILPPKPPAVNPAGRDDLVAGCRIFFPGTYTSPPSLAAQNYFVSGDYYFEFDEAFEIKQATVIGGNIDPALGDVQYLAAPDCADARDEPSVGGAEDGYGNTWFLGGGARIDVNTQGRLELFRRDQGTHALSVMAIPTTGAGYTASTNVIASGTPIMTTKSGANNDLVVHGLINAPRAQVGFGNVSNTADAQVLGGLIAAGVDMQSSASATGFVVYRASAPAQTKLRVRARAIDPAGRAVTTQAVIDYEPARFVTGATVTSGSTTVTTASPQFSVDDVGSRLVGRGLDGGTRITAVTDASSVTISVAATASAAPTRLTVETARVAINSWRKV